MSDESSILIVDDDEDICRSLSMILKHKGFDVSTAGGGKEAIDIVKERSFDFIFMDVNMPGIDGVEANRTIRQMRPETAVIMITAFSVEDMINEAIRDGAYGIVYKPLDVDSLLRLVETITRLKGKGKLNRDTEAS
jgi:DNA-binding NtrC family response regulator